MQKAGNKPDCASTVCAAAGAEDIPKIMELMSGYKQDIGEEPLTQAQKAALGAAIETGRITFILAKRDGRTLRATAAMGGPLACALFAKRFPPFSVRQAACLKIFMCFQCFAGKAWPAGLRKPPSRIAGCVESHRFGLAVRTRM